MDKPINEVELDVLQSLFSLDEKEEDNTPIETPTVDVKETEEVPEELPTQEELPTEESQTESDFFKVAQTMIKMGDLEDFVVEIEGEEKKLSEFKDIDEETLKSVIHTYKEEQKEELEKNYITVKGLTDTQQNLINIIKEGRYTDLKDVFENPESLREPWEGFDATNDLHTEQVYRVYLKHVQKMPDDDIEALVASSKKSLTLDNKAQEIVNLQRKEFKDKLEQKASDLEVRNKQEVEKQKDFSKKLSDKLKSMDLKPEIVLSMVKTATIKNTDNKTALDSLISEQLEDIDKASDLILFLTNKEIYDSNIKSKTKLAEQIDYAKRVKIVRDTKTTNTTEDHLNTTTEDAITSIFNFKN